MEPARWRCSLKHTALRARGRRPSSSRDLLFSTLRGPTCACSLFCESGRYSPLERTHVGIGEKPSVSASYVTFSQCRVFVLAPWSLVSAMTHGESDGRPECR